MANSQPLTLTVEEAAAALGVGRSTAYELARTGGIPVIRLGRRIVVPTAALAELLGVGRSELWRAVRHDDAPADLLASSV